MLYLDYELRTFSYNTLSNSFSGNTFLLSAFCYDAIISKQTTKPRTSCILHLNQTTSGMDLEALLLNPGLSHIVSNISRFLDVKSLAQCRLISQAWKDFIDTLREWWIFQLEHINHSKKMLPSSILDDVVTFSESNIMEKFPEWHGTIETFTKVKSISKLKEFVNYSGPN